jgi:hypothetical protein
MIKNNIGLISKITYIKGLAVSPYLACPFPPPPQQVEEEGGD